MLSSKMEKDFVCLKVVIIHQKYGYNFGVNIPFLAETAIYKSFKNY